MDCSAARRSAFVRWRSVRTVCCLAGWLLAFTLFAQQASHTGKITTIHELKNLSPAQSLQHRPFHIHGIVVCYDSGWNQFYVYDGATEYFNPNDFHVPLAKGQVVEISGETTGTNELLNHTIVIHGTNALPPAKPLELPQLTNDLGQWVAITGWVRSAETTSSRVALLLQEKQQNCLVYVMGPTGTNDYTRLLGCKVRVSGINASRASGNQFESPMVFASGWDEIQILQTSNPKTAAVPVVYIGSLLNRELGSWTGDPVHINGLVVSYQPGQSLVVKDPTGVIRAQVIQLSQVQPDDRVDIWGFLEVSRNETYLKNAYFKVERPAPPIFSEHVSGKEPAEHTDTPLQLTHVADILKLKREQAARHIPVQLRGVITYADPDWHNGFFQEQGDAIYLDLEQRDVRPGQWVEVNGVTSPGGFAPEVTNSSVKVLALTNLPTPAKVDLEDLANGHFDAHWVEMEGVVRRVDAQWGHLSLSLMTPKGRFKVVIPGYENKPAPEYLIDAVCQVEGACTSESNGRRQLSGITLHAPSLEQVKIIESPPADPFSVEATRIEAVGTFDPDRPAGRRIKISGVVTMKIPGQGFILQDASGGMRVFTRPGREAHVGDLLDVLGFPVIGDFSPYLEEADFRIAGEGKLPAAKKKTAEEILQQGTNDAQIVELNARLLQNVPRSANPQLVLQDGPIIFTAHVENQGPRLEVPELQSGSLLRLTGVCLIQGGEAHEPVTFRLLLREPRDIELLQAAPWWTPRHTLMVGGGMMLTIAAALGWVASLRRRVRKQTELVRQKLEREAALEERYRELFENANDMVYTHDLAGRITSINQAGEKMLQRPRNQILNHSIVELIVEEQRDAAREWLGHVVLGAEPPATEWDLMAGAGQRIKLEISARLIQREDKLVEVEGIARDITERKRLELEILEISNREQRRIGHDLHDGVCQQLAGIAYMTASLAHALQEKGVPESSKAERIGSLVNAVIHQTRGVARGLFPVRLEENGLVSALEELATNASELFKIDCRFVSEQPPSGVDNGVALHLYYIALEAVANASKHGRAKQVVIALEPFGDRYMLSVQDDGVGLPAGGVPQTGMGIRIMQYRARVIGATLNLQRGSTCGTHVTCLFLPAVRETAAEAAGRTIANRVAESARP